MKQRLLLFLSMLIMFSACRKSITNEQASSNDLIISAKNYFGSLAEIGSSTNPRFVSTRTVEWGKAQAIDFHGAKAVIAPINYLRPFYMGSSVDAGRLYNSNEITWLCMYKDSVQQYHVEQVAFFPDSSFVKNGKYSGLICVDTWEGDALKKYKVENNGTLLQWNQNHVSYKQSGAITSGVQEDMVKIIANCYEIVGYNYSVDDPNGGVYWSEPAGCTYSIISDDGGANYASITGGGGGGSGGGASGISPANNFIVLNGNNPIGNINDYDKCFTNIAGNGNTFTVTVCVDQPKPGARDAWTFSPSGAGNSSAGGSPADVGHTFLIFTQNTGGTIITRNVGFYPSSSVGPTSPTSQGQLNDDEGHVYNVSLTIAVDNSQFFKMLNYAAQGSNAGYAYNLNTNNCTTFALNTLNMGNIILPRTTGSWIDGSGNDPGDLGQDIMSLNLSTNMLRTTVNVAHPNTGSCN